LIVISTSMFMYLIPEVIAAEDAWNELEPSWNDAFDWPYGIAFGSSFRRNGRTPKIHMKGVLSVGSKRKRESLRKPGPAHWSKKKLRARGSKEGSPDNSASWKSARGNDKLTKQKRNKDRHKRRHRVNPADQFYEQL